MNRKTSFIIKTTQVVKPAKNFSAIDITKFKTLKRYTNRATQGLTAINGKWYMVDGQKTIFKPTDCNAKDYKWNEMLAYHLANNLGILCAKYDFAFHKEIGSGVVSYNFLKQGQKLLTGYELMRLANNKYTVDIGGDNSYQNYIYILKCMREEGAIVNFGSIQKQLFQTLLFDFLISNSDRHNTNLAFILYKSGDVDFIYPCPIFDNEMSFGERVDTFKKEYAEQELCDHRFYPYTKTKDDLKSYVEDLAKLCLSTKNNVKLSSDMLKNIDIAKAESELDQQGTPLNARQKDWYEKCLNYKKTLLESEIKRQLLQKDKNKSVSKNNQIEENAM